MMIRNVEHISNKYIVEEPEISGSVRGVAGKNIGAVVNLGAYYLLGFPTGILLAFVYRIGGKV